MKESRYLLFPQTKVSLFVIYDKALTVMETGYIKTVQFHKYNSSTQRKYTYCMVNLLNVSGSISHGKNMDMHVLCYGMDGVVLLCCLSPFQFCLCTAITATDIWHCHLNSSDAHTACINNIPSSSWALLSAHTYNYHMI